MYFCKKIICLFTAIDINDMIKFSFHERFKHSGDFQNIFYVADSLQFLRNISYLIIPPRECVVTSSISIHSAPIQFR